jgi:hypothetical protein
VVGGNGIGVTKTDCDYVVSLAGNTGDPTTSIRFVCDIECVESSGQYSLVVKYGTLELPAAVVKSYTSECDGSGSSGSDDGNVLGCDECLDCDTGDKFQLNTTKIYRVVDGQIECDCIGASDPVAGEALTITVSFKDDAGNVIQTQTFQCVCE